MNGILATMFFWARILFVSSEILLWNGGNWNYPLRSNAPSLLFIGHSLGFFSFLVRGVFFLPGVGYQYHFIKKLLSFNCVSCSLDLVFSALIKLDVP